MNQSILTKKHLRNELDGMKAKLNNTVDTENVLLPDILQLSRELDKLIVQYTKVILK